MNRVYRRLVTSSLILGLTPALSGCFKDETLTGYGAAGQTWILQELDGKAFASEARLTFPAPRRIAGKTPCNRFSGKQSAPYPWFQAEALAVTRMACPELPQEARFLEALQEMREVEVSGPVLILRNEQGREMLFTAGG